MNIEVIHHPRYRTSDGKVFDDPNEAIDHEVRTTEFDEVKAFVEERYSGTPRNQGTAMEAILSYLVYQEAKKTPEHEPASADDGFSDEPEALDEMETL